MRVLHIEIKEQKHKTRVLHREIKEQKQKMKALLNFSIEICTK
jgi:hypothetical protein